MGDSRAVIPVIVGILILATLGFSQEADADHITTDCTSKPLHSPAKSDILAEDIGSPTDLCDYTKLLISYGETVTLKDDAITCWQHCTILIRDSGTLIIEKFPAQLTNLGTIENYGTIFIKNWYEKSDTEVDEKYDFGTMLSTQYNTFLNNEDNCDATDGLFLKDYKALCPEEGVWYGLYNESTGKIKNYGKIINYGETVSTGKIDNYSDGIGFDNRNTFTNLNTMTNHFIQTSSSFDSLIISGSVAIIQNTGKFVNVGIIDNIGGKFLNFGGFAGIPVNMVCSPWASSWYGLDPSMIRNDPCPPEFFSPADNSVIQGINPIFIWSPGADGVTSKFWITPGNFPDIIIEEATTSGTTYSLKELPPPGIYDYFVQTTDSFGNKSPVDSQRITIEKAIFTSGEVVDLEYIPSYTFGFENVVNSGSLTYNEIVLFVNDGTQSIRGDLIGSSGGAGGTWVELGSYKVYINPNEENGVVVDEKLKSLEYNNEVYSFKYGEDCDVNGVFTVIEAIEIGDKINWKCTITFDKLGDKISEPTYDFSKPIESDVDSDGTPDEFDNCPTISNPFQEDSNADGIGDACESIPESLPTPPDPITADSDSDAITDDTDNCPTIFNPSQEDSDNDGIGDACESVEITDDTTPDTTDDTTPDTTDDTTPDTTDDTTPDTTDDTTPIPAPSESTTIKEPPKEQKVPAWIKKNAEWWAEGAIGEKDFVGGIQFLINENIIDIPDLPEQASDTSQEKVPDWIKNNAEWWAKGLISEDDFINGIKYLVEKGIIVV
jgi:hypothetical protein